MKTNSSISELLRGSLPNAVPSSRRGKPGTLLTLFLAATLEVHGAYSGLHVSSTAPATVTLGANIPVTTLVRNTGTTAWSTVGQPGFVCRFLNMSWQPGVSITYHVWNAVSPGAEASHTADLSGIDLPAAPGSYQFTVYAYYPVDSFSGNYSLMTSSPKVIQFTIPPPDDPTPGTYRPTSDATLLDMTSQGLGYLAVSTVDSLSVGENGDDRAGARGWLAFTPGSQARADIAAAQSIYLNLTPISRIDLEPPEVYVDLHGLPSRTSALATGGDYETPSVLLVSQAVTRGSPRTNLCFDVTGFVKAEAARSPASVIVFRLQMGPVVPYLDGQLNQFNFGSSDNQNQAVRPTLTLNGQPRLAAPVLGSGGDVQFLLSGALRSTCVIQASADLASWTPISTNVIPADGSILVTDPFAADHSRRFYRAQSQ